MTEEFTLNPQQAEALEELSDFKNIYVLKGYAGTGKSTVITRWVKKARKKPEDWPSNRLFRPPKIVLTAPTNKATNVLAEKAAEIRLPVDTSTIHSLLKLKMQWQDDKQVLVPDARGEDNFGAYDFVVIDECGMLNEEMMEYIIAAREAYGNKVIFMGDPCQLPPISEAESASFHQADEPKELTLVMRQKGDNNILPMSEYLRKLILSPRPGYPADLLKFEDGKSVIHMLGREFDVIEEIADLHQNSELDVRHLAWTNKVVDGWNDQIRNKIYGKERNEWMKGEQIVTTKPVLDPQSGDLLFPTDTLLTIMREPEPVKVHNVEAWSIMCQGKRLYVTTKAGQKDFNTIKTGLLAAAKQNKKLWPDFYEFMESFAYIKPAHSMTVHRSQGSTFDRVYVSYQNILANPRRKESLQCLYVAITRPKAVLVLI